MTETTPTTTPNPESVCQHCNRQVHFGMTEQGFRGFVHTDTGLATCNRD